MLTTVLDTAHLPAPDRAAAWVAATGHALITTRTTFLEPERLKARIQAMALGPAQLSVMAYTPLASQRTARLIQGSDPETYQLALTLSGQQSIEQARTYSSLGPGDLLLYDSSWPFTATVGPILGCDRRPSGSQRQLTPPAAVAPRSPPCSSHGPPLGPQT
ncbi:hypothetical protein [Streptomyces sp. NPDC046870]|uniref:AraC-like ligand-binding domain-containing protein n=1 Tax=Streptomyces sp. NPDC046870 TaxID=3155135 RepID=UPI003456C893